MKQFLNKHISDIQPKFKKNNQPTCIYNQSKLLENFGSNEGGPSYEIYIDQTGIILEIKQFDMNFDTLSIDVTTYI
jgi:hypothetical protein